MVLPEIPLGNSAYERKNDKNYVQKQIKLVAVKNSQKRAKLTQNKERVKTLKMKMMSQKTIVII